MKKEKEKKEQLVHYHNYELFTIVEDNREENKTFILTLGKYKLKEFENLEDAKKFVDKKDWELITQVITIIYQQLKEMKNEK